MITAKANAEIEEKKETRKGSNSQTRLKQEQTPVGDAEMLKDFDKSDNENASVMSQFLDVTDKLKGSKRNKT